MELLAVSAAHAVWRCWPRDLLHFNTAASRGSSGEYVSCADATRAAAGDSASKKGPKVPEARKGDTFREHLDDRKHDAHSLTAE